MTASALGEGAAFAQTAPAPTAPAPGTPAAEDPDKLFAEGVQAGRQGNWAKAREKLAKAFELKPQPETAAKLGVTENRLAAQSRPEDRTRLSRDAAEHISYYLRNAPSIPPPVRSDAEGELKKATVNVGEVTLALDPPAAEVTVDGRPAGKAPLRGSIFVEPGHRRFEAKSEGFLPTSKELDVAAAGTYNVELTLARDPKASPPTPPAPPGGVTGPGTPHEPQLDWRPYARWGGLGLAVVGVGVGVGLTVAIQSNNAKVDAEADRLAHTASGPGPICPNGDNEPRCATLTAMGKTGYAYQSGAIAGYVVGGVGVVGVLMSVIWKPKVPEASPPPTSSLVLLPSLSGVTVMGTF